MLFNSYEFMFFFPIVVIAYFIIPQKARWAWLLVASYYFYMSWNPKYAILIATSTVITFLSGILISKANQIENEGKRKKRKKMWVALSFGINIGILFFFKYFNFFLDSMNSVLAYANIALDPPMFDILLPVGISFYTFQALSYTMDVYRGDLQASRHLGKYALFVSFFPQLVAGPIERAQDLLPQFDERHTFDYSRMKRGLMLMLWGFFLKLVIADRVAILVNTVYNNYQLYAGFETITATVFFAVQIYCDFAAYSLIAMGAAEVMGYRLTQNFDRPYFSKSIKEFWRRWHITLGAWFKYYVYIPLGGNRKGKAKTYRNTMIVFLTSGLWHGASWNFAIWGLLHGGYQVAEDALLPLRTKTIKKLRINEHSFSHKLFQTALTFVLVCFAWVFFRANTLADSIGIIGNSLYFNPQVFFNGDIFKLGLNATQMSIAVGAMAVLLLSSWLARKGSVRDMLLRQNLALQWILFFAGIFTILIFGIYGPAYDAQAFIYFQF